MKANKSECGRYSNVIGKNGVWQELKKEKILSGEHRQDLQKFSID